MEGNFKPKETIDERIRILQNKKNILDDQIKILEAEILNLPNEEENPVNSQIKIEGGKVHIDSIIRGNLDQVDFTELAKEGVDESEISDVIQKITLEEINNVNTSQKKFRNLDKIRNKFRKIFLGLMVVSSFQIISSFNFTKSKNVLAYEELKIENFNDWENIKLDQEKINKLENLFIINTAQEKIDEKYLVVDKLTALSHLYQRDSLISTYEVGIGENKGDEQTETIVKNGRVYWELGNKQTGAGIYTIKEEVTYGGLPCFILLNERGIAVPSALHKTKQSRRKLFNNNNIEDNRMSYGCVNFQANDIKKLAKIEGFGPGTKIFILPEDENNKFQIIDGELRFLSDNKNVNRTIKNYEPYPAMFTTENPNNTTKEFLYCLSKYKSDLMKIYPTVSNDTYHELVKIAYGILGQESSFGTYGGVRGQIGRIKDFIGSQAGYDVSLGIGQIRFSSINKEIKEKFNINKQKDLFNTEKASIAMMSILLDIYTKSIPINKKHMYKKLVPLFYNNPKSIKNISSEKDIKSEYLNKVDNKTDEVKIYVSNY